MREKIKYLLFILADFLGTVWAEFQEVRDEVRAFNIDEKKS